MKKLSTFYQTIKTTEFTTKITIYLSSTSAGDAYDPYENNKASTNLNPVTIKGYVHEVSPESLVYKQYGLHNMGAVEIVCEKRYKKYFQLANKIVIGDNEFQVFKEAVGSKALIQERSGQLLRVILNKLG